MDLVTMSTLPSLQELLNEIETGAIPLQNALRSADCDELLDLRDSTPSFDKTYLDSFAKIDDLRSSLPDDPSEMICKQAFVFVSIATNHHEIASYASDDFELIAWASHCQSDPNYGNFNFEFAQWLLSEYRAGRFPVPSHYDK